MSPLNGPSPDRNSKNWGLINDNLLGRSLSGKAILRKSRIHSGAIGVSQNKSALAPMDGVEKRHMAQTLEAETVTSSALRMV
jgi:hypothetical protein